MSRLVLDASTVLTWCFPDEHTEKAVQISERIAAGARIVVPTFWRHEILNALLVGERRKRITAELTRSFLQDLTLMPVDLDSSASSVVVFDATQALCRKHGLTAYDAAYLELAMQEKLTLATVDRDLQSAAIAESVALI